MQCSKATPRGAQGLPGPSLPPELFAMEWKARWAGTSCRGSSPTHPDAPRFATVDAGLTAVSRPPSAAAVAVPQVVQTFGKSAFGDALDEVLNERVLKTLKRDMHRTLQQFSAEAQGGATHGAAAAGDVDSTANRQALERVVRALVASTSGEYCQGQNLLAAALLVGHGMDEMQAFCIGHWLLVASGLLGLYAAGSPVLDMFVECFRVYLQRFASSIEASLNSKMSVSGFPKWMVIEWATAMFSTVLPLPHVMAVVDLLAASRTVYPTGGPPASPPPLHSANTPMSSRSLRRAASRRRSMLINSTFRLRDDGPISPLSPRLGKAMAAVATPPRRPTASMPAPSSATSSASTASHSTFFVSTPPATAAGMRLPPRTPSTPGTSQSWWRRASPGGLGSGAKGALPPPAPAPPPLLHTQDNILYRIMTGILLELAASAGLLDWDEDTFMTNLKPAVRNIDFNAVLAAAAALPACEVEILDTLVEGAFAKLPFDFHIGVEVVNFKSNPSGFKSRLPALMLSPTPAYRRVPRSAKSAAAPISGVLLSPATNHRGTAMPLAGRHVPGTAVDDSVLLHRRRGWGGTGRRASEVGTRGSPPSSPPCDGSLRGPLSPRQGIVSSARTSPVPTEPEEGGGGQPPPPEVTGTPSGPRGVTWQDTGAGGEARRPHAGSSDSEGLTVDDWYALGSSVGDWKPLSTVVLGSHGYAAPPMSPLRATSPRDADSSDGEEEGATGAGGPPTLTPHTALLAMLKSSERVGPLFSWHGSVDAALRLEWCDVRRDGSRLRALRLPGGVLAVLRRRLRAADLSCSASVPRVELMDGVGMYYVRVQVKVRGNALRVVGASTTAPPPAAPGDGDCASDAQPIEVEGAAGGEDGAGSGDAPASPPPQPAASRPSRLSSVAELATDEDGFVAVLDKTVLHRYSDFHALLQAFLRVGGTYEPEGGAASGGGPPPPSDAPPEADASWLWFVPPTALLAQDASPSPVPSSRGADMRAAASWHPPPLPQSCVDAFPPKRWLFNTDPAVLAQRREALSQWLQDVMHQQAPAHPALSKPFEGARAEAQGRRQRGEGQASPPGHSRLATPPPSFAARLGAGVSPGAAAPMCRFCLHPATIAFLRVEVDLLGLLRG